MICYLYAANIGKITLRVKPFHHLFFAIKDYLTHLQRSGNYSAMLHPRPCLAYLPKSMDIPAMKFTPSVRGAFR